MKNCHSELMEFHNACVTLSNDERSEMRERRNSNRDRLKGGLTRDEEPKASLMKSQGSYAMRTMVQDKDKDYDIDDGIYFDKDLLKGPRGGDRTPADVKEMIRKAVHEDTFTTPPKVRTNCVRVYYSAGYHVDLPVYRISHVEKPFGETEDKYELASTNWKSSDPGQVTEWFNSNNKALSPDLTNGGQLRRITRYLKSFSRSRESWGEKIASGFIISALVIELYQSNETREDMALYDTMNSIRNRLNWNLEVDHPVLAEKLTKGPDDVSTKFFREKLGEAITNLENLFDSDCTNADALKAWDKVFKTTFFSDPPDRGGNGNNGGGKTSAAILKKNGQDEAVRNSVNKKGGGTYAEFTRN